MNKTNIAMVEPARIKERPIPFSGPMVKAILEGRKTQTRRVLNQFHAMALSDVAGGGAEPVVWWPRLNGELLACPHGVPGDRLWVRETFSYAARYGYDAPQDGRAGVGDDQTQTSPIWYRASDTGQVDGPWRPSIFMPRWASRITLEITDVRVQRIQEISEDDSLAEGIAKFGSLELYGYDPKGTPGKQVGGTAKEAFGLLWEAINFERGYGWHVNPWVWCISFRRLDV